MYIIGNMYIKINVLMCHKVYNQELLAEMYRCNCYSQCYALLAIPLQSI